MFRTWDLGFRVSMVLVSAALVSAVFRSMFGHELARRPSQMPKAKSKKLRRLRADSRFAN